MEALGYIAGILPWRMIGQVICWLGLLVTAGIGWYIATNSIHSVHGYYAATTGGGLGLMASALALASGLHFLRRP
jgi:hypothetical protein